MADNINPPATPPATAASLKRLHRIAREKSIITGLFNTLVLLLSVMLIVWISLDTFNNVDFLNSRPT